MRAFAVLSLLLATAAAPMPASVDALARDAEARWVPFELTDANQIRFTLLVDGRPARAILDTGVAWSAVSRHYAEAARMRVRPGQPGVAIGGIVTTGWVDTETVTFGALSRRGGRVTVIDLPDTVTGGHRIDMLVGQDFTAGYALDIDYDGRRFRLLPSGRLPFRGTALPLRVAGATPFYITTLTIADRPVGRVMVDTGDGNALTMSHATWHALAFAGLPVSSIISFGLGGATVSDLAILPIVRAGDLRAPRVPIGIEPEGGFTQTVGLSARIGSGFLQRYRVLLDPGAGRMVLEPGAQADTPPVRSTSGLLLRPEGGRLTVLHVMRGSPAAAAGWYEGEQICSVDGAPVTDGPSMRWTIGDPGRIVTLGLCDGSARTLTLRYFY